MISSDSSERPKIDFIGGKDGIIAGQNVTMVCSAEGGNPPPRLYWLLEDREINSTVHYDIEKQVRTLLQTFVFCPHIIAYDRDLDHAKHLLFPGQS